MSKHISDEQILVATRDVIVAYGYEGATTKLIATTAGINEVTLFRKFGNKANLVLALVKQEAKEFSQEGIGYTGDLEADLERAVHFYAGIFQRQGPFILQIMAELSRRPELQEGVQSIRQNLLAVINLITMYQEQGQLCEEPPLQAVSALMAPVMVMNTASQLVPTLFDQPIDVQQHVRVFLRGRCVS